MIDVSLVLPTYNRRQALEQTLPALLALEGVDELVIVVDGSTDETAEFLRAQADPRLRVIEHDVNRGQPAARNTGIAAARGTWLFLADDDVRLPPDYIARLRQAATELGADIMSAPWVHVHPGTTDQEVAAIVAARRADPVDQIHLDLHPGRFPARPLLTPFLNGASGFLLRREVFDELNFDDGFRGNAYREETDFLLRALKAGYSCGLTPTTFSLQDGQWAGGQRRSRLAYEWWAARNNWRFLQRHGDWLVAHGEGRGVVRMQARFVAWRAWLTITLVTARIWRSVRR